VLYDITPRIEPGLAVWPGDTPFSWSLVASMAAGARTNVGSLATTAHLGAHVDAPFHTEAQGQAVDRLPLERFWGPCWVIATPSVDLLLPEHLGDADLASTPRVLFKTGTARDRSRFPERCAALSLALVDALAARCALLVGLDTPSVDPLDSQTLDAHHALNRHGISNLEGVLLDDVPPGRYELAALPLRLVGLDASPVRAVLRSL
jgi:arylformamidase